MGQLHASYAADPQGITILNVKKQMNKLYSIDDFMQKYNLSHPTTIEEYAIFCKASVKIAFKYPSEKCEVAYIILGKTSKYLDKANPDPLLDEIWYLAGQLELPDHAVYVGDGISIKEKWQILKDDIDELVESLNIKS